MSQQAITRILCGEINFNGGVRWVGDHYDYEIKEDISFESLFIFLPLNSSGSTTTDDFFIVRLMMKILTSP